MSIDYMRAAGEVLAKTADGGKAFDAYCHMRMVIPAYGGPFRARDEMRNALAVVWPRTVENCAAQFEAAMFRLGYDEFVAADSQGVPK